MEARCTVVKIARRRNQASDLYVILSGLANILSFDRRVSQALYWYHFNLSLCCLRHGHPERAMPWHAPVTPSISSAQKLRHLIRGFLNVVAQKRDPRRPCQRLSAASINRRCSSSALRGADRFCAHKFRYRSEWSNIAEQAASIRQIRRQRSKRCESSCDGRSRRRRAICYRAAERSRASQGDGGR